MRDQKQRQLALFADIPEQCQDSGLGADVQRGERLIGKQQAWIHGQRARQGDSLALAPGKSCRPPVHLPRVQTDAAQQRGHAVLLFLAGAEPVGSDGFGDDAFHRPAGIEAGIGVLEHHLQMARTGRRARILLVESRESELPRGYPDDARERAGNRGLARTGLPHQADCFVGVNREIHFLHRRLPGAAVADRKAAQRGQGLTCFPAPAMCRDGSTPSRQRVQERACVVVAGFREQFAGRAMFHHPPAVHDVEAVAESCGHRQVVGDHQQRMALCAALEQFKHS